MALAYFTTGGAAPAADGVAALPAGTAVSVALGRRLPGRLRDPGAQLQPRKRRRRRIGGVISNLVLQRYAPAVLGGPLRWTAIDQFSLANPGNAGQLLCLALIGLLIREIARTRTRSARAWWLPVFFLACDVLLVVAGRASFVGPLIALDFRYQGELPAVTALALACATMPIIGALEPVTPSGESSFLVRPAAGCGGDRGRVGAGAGFVDAVRVALADHDAGQAVLLEPPRPLEASKEPIPWSIRRRRTSSCCRSGTRRTCSAACWSTTRGRTSCGRPPTTSTSSTTTARSCRPRSARRPTGSARTTRGLRLCRARRREIPLDGPVGYGGWWVRVGYLASDTSPVVVTAGDAPSPPRSDPACTRSTSTAARVRVHQDLGSQGRGHTVHGRRPRRQTRTNPPAGDSMTFRDRTFPR